MRHNLVYVPPITAQTSIAMSCDPLLAETYPEIDDQAGASSPKITPGNVNAYVRTYRRYPLLLSMHLVSVNSLATFLLPYTIYHVQSFFLVPMLHEQY